jgi:uncharacterized protein
VRLRLDLSPRLTYPDPRVDALRGCVAIERGPFVYCFEQTDQSARLDELAVIPGPGQASTVSASTVSASTVSANAVSANTGLAEHPATLPGIGATVQITAPGRHVTPEAAESPAGWSSRPAPAAAAESSAPATVSDGTAESIASAESITSAESAVPGSDDRTVTVTAIPYFQWDNRGPGAMRVWIPVASPYHPS